MIAAGLTHVATIFAAVMFAARRCKVVPEISDTKGQGSGLYGPKPSPYLRHV